MKASWPSCWRKGAVCRSPRYGKTRRSSPTSLRHSGAAGRHDRGRMLKLVPRTSTRGQHMPIDSFLRTLAQIGSKAIGVVLSGTATDGTLGVKAIKRKAASPSPRIRPRPGTTACAQRHRLRVCGLVLRPDEIARELCRLSRHPYVIAAARGASVRAATFSAEGGGWPQGDPGITSQDYRTTSARTSQRRSIGGSRGAWPSSMSRRWRITRATSKAVGRGAGPISGLSDHGHFIFPRPGDLPGPVRISSPAEGSATGAPIRVWVPGCATGEEVYSIVICLLERAGELKANSSFQVFATDLSESALEKARAGKYWRTSLRTCRRSACSGSSPMWTAVIR